MYGRPAPLRRLRKPEDCRARDRYTRPMTTEPRDPALAALAGATVRVGKGSGVVIWPPNSALLIATAAHVVRTGETHMVRKGSVFEDRPVIARDEDLDVALLTAPSGLEKAAIEVADETTGALPGDGVWAAGFPRGWSGPDPVLARGTIAGLGDENWINVDGTWGNSGGPIVRVIGGASVVVGILLAKAGQANRDLESLRKDVRAFDSDLEVEIAKKTKQPGSLSDPKVIQFLDAAKTASLHARSSDRILGLLDDHFRTGFLRFAPVADLRKLLVSG